jgi:hypothetical protein
MAGADLRGSHLLHRVLILVALDTMAQIDVSHLVPQDGREFGFVLKEVHHAAQKVDMAAGQRERVHRGRFHHVKLIRHVAALQVRQEGGGDGGDVLRVARIFSGPVLHRGGQTVAQRRFLRDTHRVARKPMNSASRSTSLQISRADARLT